MHRGRLRQVMIIRADGVERWAHMAKTAVAGKLADEVAEALG